MRVILCGVLLALSFSVYASRIQCYSAGKLILNTHSKEVYYTEEGIVVYRDPKTKKDTFIINPECVVEI